MIWEFAIENKKDGCPCVCVWGGGGCGGDIINACMKDALPMLLHAQTQAFNNKNIIGTIQKANTA